MEVFREHENKNLRFLCLLLFIRNANDEESRIVALDLLATLANVKTLDGIGAKTQAFQEKIICRVIEICSNKYCDLLNDLYW
jgi:hypothetical protein